MGRVEIKIKEFLKKECGGFAKRATGKAGWTR